MNTMHEQAKLRQQALLSDAAEHHDAHQARRVIRAARRAERAERQLSRSWHQAMRRRAELTQLAD